MDPLSSDIALTEASVDYLGLPDAQATPDNVFNFPNRTLRLVSVRGLFRLESTPHASGSSSSVMETITNPISGERRPALISVRVFKLRSDMPLGLEIGVVDDVTVISSISPTGLFAGSPLRPGDALLGSGHQDWDNKWTSHITVKVHTMNCAYGTAEAVVFKQAASSPIGLSFVNKTGRLQISRIDPNGLLGSSVLKVGDYIESINSCNVAELDVSSAKDILKSTAGYTSIQVRSSVVSSISVNALMPSIGLSGLDLEQGLVTAEDIHSPRTGGPSTFDTFGEMPSLLSILKHRTDVDSDLGIELRKIPAWQSGLSRGKLVIAGISDRGLFSKFPLEVGDVVLSINYRSKPLGKPGLVQAIATVPRWVPSDEFRLGMTFRGGGSMSLQIGTMQSWCPFMHSILDEGDTLVGIDGIPSEHLTPSDAIAIVRRPTEQIALLARVSKDRAVVLHARHLRFMTPVDGILQRVDLPRLELKSGTIRPIIARYTSRPGAIERNLNGAIIGEWRPRECTVKDMFFALFVAGLFVGLMIAISRDLI